MDEKRHPLQVIGGVARRLRFERGCSIQTGLGVTPDPIFRLAALALFIEEDALRLTEKLRLSSAEANELTAWRSQRPPHSAISSVTPWRRRFTGLGRASVLLLLLAGRNLLLRKNIPHGKQAAKLASTWQRPNFRLLAPT